VIYQRNNTKTGWDIWAVPREANAAPIVVQTDADERNARLSPDGRWVAFASNSSNISEIYVQPFPGPGRVSRISIKGGDSPQWRLDGKELFYLALDGKVMAAPIKPAADSQSLELGAPVALFAASVGIVAGPPSSSYAASADGQRFLMNRLVREAGDTSVRVVLNWRGGQ
jgi:dipeptidyl aminopeptidase/acylaminoacyl peptidase